MRGIDKLSDVPLYKQIIDIIAEEVKEGVKVNGDKILSEPELADLYQVSRMTVRQAINELVRQRLLVRKRGFGTYVAGKHVQRTLRPNVVTGFFEEFSTGGNILESRVVDNSLVIVPDEVAEAIGIPKKTEVYRLSRVRELDNNPIVYDVSYLNSKLWPKLRHIDFTATSLFNTLKEVTGKTPQSAEITIHASIADDEISSYLRISMGDPIMVAEMINHFENMEILQVGYLYCPETLDMKFTIGKD